ncbi:alpha-2-HS-glycoprotein 2 [Alosa sapidissima]|uniref:alpha-2-HS-glycoprotein 2 n=1 Tax=Alosa sapidissima TaxID=34773 RepID=UPI001C08E450|nr:alpha-2-HS-glycoprotein 2 [Alosa sapidissima]
MRVVCVLLGVVVGAWAMVLPKLTEPPCDSLEAEAAAAVFQDYINAQRTSGFKYALNQIDKIKIKTLANMEIYKMELDLLETKCHVLDPTPVTACPVRNKAEVAVDADCDVVFIKSGGVLKVKAHRCKTEPESAEDVCLDCHQLLALNDTNALQMATVSLDAFNNRIANVSKYAMLEVGRLSTQVIVGAPYIFAEYAIVETNCTTTDDDYNCVPLNKTVATYGFCRASSDRAQTAVECRIFAPQLTDPNTNVTMPATSSPVPPTNNTVPVSGIMPILMVDMMLSAESAESLEPVKVASIIPIVKRQAPAAETVAPGGQPVPVPFVPICPGKKKHF